MDTDAHTSSPVRPATQGRSSPRYSRIVFTLNNYTELEYAWFKTYVCKWIVVGRETGESGTPHLQGACVLGTRRTLAALKKLPGFARAHIEKMQGTPQASLKYCTKQDKNAYVRGDIPKEGKRTDLEEVAEDILNGATLEEIALKHPKAMIQYSKGLTVLHSYQVKPRRPTEPPTVIWIYGATGTGKTRAAFETSERLFGEGRCWISND